MSSEDRTPFRRPEETPTLLARDDAPLREPAAPQFAPGTVLGEGYRIVAPLGSGGQGEVYRADDLRLGQTVALKFVLRARPDLDRRLLDEVRIGCEITHSTIQLTTFPRAAMVPLTLGGGHLVVSTILLVMWESMMRSIGAVMLLVGTLWRIPITLDRSAWYFSASMVALLFLAAIPIYGFITSTAGKRRFPRLAFEV